jgi:DNA end-binding protein Ku
MAARAIWSGNLKLGSASFPVKLYSAAQDRSVRFHILEKKTKSRVRQHMLDPETGREVTSDAIHKGYEVEPGVFVLIDEKDIESV